MSVQAITWAFSQRVESSAAKFVLVSLANFANENGEAYPCIRTISELTSLDRKTVLLALHRLKEAGLIDDTGKRKGRTLSVLVYQLSCPKNGASPKTDGSRPVFPMKQSRFSAKHTQKRATDPFRTVSEPSGKGSPKEYTNETLDRIKALEQDANSLFRQYALENSIIGTTWRSRGAQVKWKEIKAKIVELRSKLRTTP